LTVCLFMAEKGSIQFILACSERRKEIETQTAVERDGKSNYRTFCFDLKKNKSASMHETPTHEKHPNDLIVYSRSKR
jgi:hypothetical protein